MSESEEQTLRRTIATICQSDPLIKLLRQVRLGRMQPADAGLRVVTESWIEIYRKAIAVDGFTAQSLRRLDPTPRLAVLIEAGILPADAPAVIGLASAFEQTMARASR